MSRQRKSNNLRLISKVHHDTKADKLSLSVVVAP